ncbi:MAG: pilus (MSHA type) biogenesis protein MshL [Dissulfurimicrobium sp.]|uniref:pilus (MSHA type) biogenesis protein MshL n=1 Tax=Dissulfurimicrobium sp. TaxID=2022436 RepID=UPI003D0D05AC
MGEIHFKFKERPAARYSLIFLCLFFVMIAYGCAVNTDSVQKKPFAAAVDIEQVAIPHSANAADGSSLAAGAHNTGGAAAKVYRPGVMWQPAYSVGDVAIQTNEAKLSAMPVGADIHTRGGRVRLGDAVRQLAKLKGMSVNWASDVNQDLPVEVNINADDDFWKALSGILRQLDYFYEFKDNTITVRYKDTKRFYLPMPFMETSYKTSVGGDLLGGASVSGGSQGGSGGGDKLKAVLSSEHDSDKVDIWVSINKNLDKILNLATAQAQQKIGGELTPEEEDRIRALCEQQFPQMPAEQALCLEKARSERKMAFLIKGSETDSSKQKVKVKPGDATDKLGEREGYYYTIDKPLGIVTVTAPKSILEQVENYFNTLKKEMSRQVVIEAKIVEIYLNQNSQQGIDWTGLLKNSPFDFKVTFGNGGVVVPKQGTKFIGKLTMGDKAFTLLLNAIGEYGHTKVLSDPKLTLMNGQSAMMTVGTSISYLAKVTSTINNNIGGGGQTTYTTETGNVLSGVGLGVMANISSDDEVVLQLTPVTSKLEKDPPDQVVIGSQATGFAQVGLPRVFMRELTTVARVKNGQILVVGGLIDENIETNNSEVPLLGDVPLIGRLFKNTQKTTQKRELVILLRPEIVNL